MPNFFRIACMDNMNNNMFCLTRYLRDKGYNCDLIILTKKSGHFNPDADTYTEEYKSYTKYLDWDDRNFLDISKSEITELINQYQFIIGSSHVPAYLAKIGRSLDIFAPHGSDLISYPILKEVIKNHFKRKKASLQTKAKSLPVHSHNSLHNQGFFSKIKNSIGTLLRARFQWYGINKANHVFFDITNQELDDWISKTYNFGKKRILSAFPYIYIPQYHSPDFGILARSTSHFNLFNTLREKYSFIVFHHSSHSWVNPVYSYAQKRNDLLIKAFSQFVNECKNPNTLLILFEYGVDVQASKELIKVLGIEANVYWMPLMQRKDIMIGISICADIGMGEFGNSWYSYGAINEYITLGKPVCHFRDDSLYKNRYPNMYPMYTANSQESILKVLIDYTSKREEYIKTGEQAKGWFEENTIYKPLSNITKLIDQKAIH